ncbi:hypothetical protein F5Y12DRAFT_783380 [Xylaria sp. FL1777]|nr:hypothetical protein F5Y12DRAFT_783380 [Xylaria sp. FL1777]
MDRQMEISVVGEGDVTTEILYLQRDTKWEHEQPYEMRYQAKEDFPFTNAAHEARTVNIRDFRAVQGAQNYEDYGFSIANTECPLTPSEFADDNKVESMFYPVARRLLEKMFPDAAEIRILEHTFRKRDVQFLGESDNGFDTIQPATAVHIDYSPRSVVRLASAFDIDPGKYTRFSTVNVWKSVQGPGNDWPLGLCDRRTIHHESEAIAADVVFPNRYIENMRLYSSPRHAWYYVKDLKDDECIVFHQLDSDGTGGVAHASFRNPKSDHDAAPRASIELRAYLFYA